MPPPQRRNPAQEFRAALARGQFLLQQCRDCGGHMHEPLTSCQHCSSGELRWVEASGRGTVCSRAVVLQGLPGEDEHPLVLIELEEGPLIAGRVLDVDADKLVSGMPVSAHVTLVDGEPGLVFYNKEQGSKEW